MKLSDRAQRARICQCRAGFSREQRGESRSQMAVRMNVERSQEGFAGQKGPVGDAGADGGPLNSTQCQLHFFKPPPGTPAGTRGVDAAHLLTKNNSCFTEGIRWRTRRRCSMWLLCH